MYFQYRFAFNDWHGRKRNWPAVKILGISLANLADCVVEIIELPSIKYGRCRGDAVELDGSELVAVSHIGRKKDGTTWQDWTGALCCGDY